MAYTPGVNGGRVNFGVAGNISGASSVQSTGSVYLAGGTNITMQQSANTVYINATGPSLSRWEYPQQMFGPLNTIQSMFQGQLSVQHMYIPLNVAVSEGKIGGQLSVQTTSNGSMRTASVSLWMGVYTLSGSTLNLLTNGSANNTFSYYGGTSTSATSVNLGVNGMRQFTVPLAAGSATPFNITAGEYWVAAVMSSITQTTNQAISFTNYGNNQIAGAASSAVITPIGASPTVSARDVILFQGIKNTTSFAMPSAINATEINNSSASYVQWANFYNALYNATY